MTSLTRPTSNGPAEDRDAVLLEQVAARADLLLRDLAAGRPAELALRPLLGYLREVVLARICQCDSIVFPGVVRSGPDRDVERLRHEHLLLREDIEDLAAALSQPDPDSSALADVTRRLVHRLQEHLLRETGALAGAPSTERADPPEWADAMRWYPLTDGPVIELNQLAGADVPRALAARLAALRPGELLELRGHGDPHLLHEQVLGPCIDSFTWERCAVDRDRAQGWTVFVRRRQE